MKSLSELSNVTLEDDMFKAPGALPDKTEVIAQVKNFEEKTVKRKDGTETNVVIFSTQIVEVLDGPSDVGDLRKYKTLVDHEIWDDAAFARFVIACGVPSNMSPLEAAEAALNSRFRSTLSVKTDDKGYDRVKYGRIVSA